MGGVSLTLGGQLRGAERSGGPSFLPSSKPGPPEAAFSLRRVSCVVCRVSCLVSSVSSGGEDGAALGRRPVIHTHAPPVVRVCAEEEGRSRAGCQSHSSRTPGDRLAERLAERWQKGERHALPFSPPKLRTSNPFHVRTRPRDSTNTQQQQQRQSKQNKHPTIIVRPYSVPYHTP